MSIEGISESEEVVPFEYDKSYRESLAEAVTKIAQGCITPFWLAEASLHYTFLPLHSGEYGQNRSAIQEVVRRVFWGMFKVPTFIMSLPLAGLGIVLTGIGNLLQTKNYRADCGTFKGEMNKDTKLMMLNPRMLPGGLPYSMAGLTPASDRLDRLVSTIRDNNPDIVFLPEINASVRSSLRNTLNDRYHFFFSNMGRRTLGMDASFFIAFRGTLKNTPQFTPFKNQDLAMERGFFSFENHDTRYFFTFLPTLEDLKEICAEKMDGKKVVLMGDLGFERGSPSFEYIEKQGFISGLKERTPTETNAPYLHLYEEDQEENKVEKGMIFIKGKGVAEAIPMHLDSKIDEALSNQSMILTKILA
ncbi:MAG: endonuclease/exonuclease/phosphatase family protein [Simkaniaceae bacterium]|nr:MAG: endonuclease/exonuclease/phosphatase family protein [Simkaniaceae bacterium]